MLSSSQQSHSLLPPHTHTHTGTCMHTQTQTCSCTHARATHAHVHAHTHACVRAHTRCVSCCRALALLPAWDAAPALTTGLIPIYSKFCSHTLSSKEPCLLPLTECHFSFSYSIHTFPTEIPIYFVDVFLYSCSSTRAFLLQGKSIHAGLSEQKLSVVP